MNKRIRKILLAMLMACLCVVFAVGAAFALFSDQVTIHNRLDAGTLKIGLTRVGYRAVVADDTGAFTTTTDNTEVDLTNYAGSLFNMNKAIPGANISVDMEITNLGDVAFDYGLRMMWNDDSATEVQKEFARQIQITVTLDQAEKARFTLFEGQNIEIGELAAGDTSQVFTVKAEFINNDNNNYVQGAGLEFDLQIYAVQKTA